MYLQITEFPLTYIIPYEIFEPGVMQWRMDSNNNIQLQIEKLQFNYNYNAYIDNNDNKQIS